MSLRFNESGPRLADSFPLGPPSSWQIGYLADGQIDVDDLAQRRASTVLYIVCSPCEKPPKPIFGLMDHEADGLAVRDHLRGCKRWCFLRLGKRPDQWRLLSEYATERIHRWWQTLTPALTRAATATRRLKLKRNRRVECSAMVRRCHSIWVAMLQPHKRKPFRESPDPIRLLLRFLSPRPTGARLSETADAAACPRAGLSQSQTPKSMAACSAVTAPPGSSTQPGNVCHGGELPTWAGGAHSSNNQRSRP